MKLTKLEEDLIYILSGFAAWIAVRKDVQIKLFSALCVLFFSLVFGAIFVLIDLVIKQNIPGVFEYPLLVMAFTADTLASFSIKSLKLWLIAFILLICVDKDVRQSSWVSAYNNRNSMTLIFFARIISLYFVLHSIVSTSLPLLTFLAVPVGLYALRTIPLSTEELLKRKKRLLDKT